MSVIYVTWKKYKLKLWKIFQLSSGCISVKLRLISYKTVWWLLKEDLFVCRGGVHLLLGAKVNCKTIYTYLRVKNMIKIKQIQVMNFQNLKSQTEHYIFSFKK